jgi:phage gpG-like protein
MLSIAIKDDATPALKRLSARATDLSVPMQAIASAWQSQVVLGFDGSVDPYGRRWAALKSRNGQPLLDRGRLRTSFQAASGRDFATVGTNLKYAEPHQTGFTIAKRAATLAFNKKGRFTSRAAASRRKAGSVRVAFATVGGGVVPARKMLPDAGLPNAWKAIIDEALDAWLGAV